MPVYFHSETFDFTPENSKQLAQWVLDVIQGSGQTAGDINYIFCDDEYLLKVNQDYLQHDYYTDIITFDYSEDEIAGDLFISLDRVKDNAAKLDVDWQEELHRVMIHGILHLLGYNDKTEEEEKTMRLLENQQLMKRNWVDVPRGTSK